MVFVVGDRVAIPEDGLGGTVAAISQFESQDYLSVKWDDGDESGIFDDQVIPEESSMHYRNGREAKNGDKVVQIGWYGTSAEIVAVGVLHGATPGNDFCNGNIAPVQNAVTGACLCDCLHVDDVAEMLKEKGLDKRPSGK